MVDIPTHLLWVHHSPGGLPIRQHAHRGQLPAPLFLYTSSLQGALSSWPNYSSAKALGSFVSQKNRPGTCIFEVSPLETAADKCGWPTRLCPPGTSPQPGLSPLVNGRRGSGLHALEMVCQTGSPGRTCLTMRDVARTADLYSNEEVPLRLCGGFLRKMRSRKQASRSNFATNRGKDFPRVMRTGTVFIGLLRAAYLQLGHGPKSNVGSS